MDSPRFASGGRYPVLRSLAILYLLGSGIAVLAGVAAAGWMLFAAPDSIMNRIILALSVLAATFFVTITMLAVAELLKLFIDMEHNTRAAAMSRSGAVVTDGASAVMVTDGGAMGGRLSALDEETAEAALLRGH